MNSLETNVTRGLLLTVLIGLLMACGGGGGSASTSEPVVAKGVITEMGSIWVNGVEYETPDGGSYKNDDSTSTSASYEVGQVVSLRGRRNDDGVSGTADVVEYEAEIEGAADSASTINGVTILIDDNSTNILDAPSINAGALAINQRYEVSGFRVGDFIIQATFIKHDDDTGPSGDGIDEIKGRVDVVVPATSITVNSVVYLWANASDFSEGNIVEVHFDPTSGPQFQATDVQLEDNLLDNPDDGQEAEIEGPVNLTATDIADCPTLDFTTVFMIGETCIDWSSVPSDGWQDGLTDKDDLVSGLRVEAEGHYNADDLLIAEKIKGRGNQVRVTAIASNVDGTGGPGTLDVFGGAIQVTTQIGLTEIEDSPVNNGGFEIRGIRTGATSVLALRIKADNNVDLSDHELRAKVDDNGVNSSPNPDNTITVMGISSIVNTFTKLVDEDVVIWPGDGMNNDTDVDFFLNDIDNDGIVTTTNGPNDVVDVKINLSAAGSDGSLADPYTAEEVEIQREDD